MDDKRSPKRIKLEAYSPAEMDDSTVITSQDQAPLGEVSSAAASIFSNTEHVAASETNEREADGFDAYGSEAYEGDISDDYLGDSSTQSITSDWEHVDSISAASEPSQPATPAESTVIVLETDQVSDSDQLLQRLASLVTSGKLTICNGGEFKLDANRLPVVHVPPPLISTSFLLGIRCRLDFCLSLTPSWAEFHQQVKNELREAQRGNATWTHAHVWSLVTAANDKTMADINTMESLSEYLTNSPSSIRKLRLLGQLPQRVCRLIGIPASYNYDEDAWQEDLADKLFVKDYYCYSEMDRVCREIRLSWRLPAQDTARVRSPPGVGEVLHRILQRPSIQQQAKMMDKREFVALRQAVEDHKSGE